MACGVGGALQKLKEDQCITVSVIFLDSSEETFQVKCASKGQSLLKQVCAHLNLLEREYFGLHFTQSCGSVIWVDPDMIFHNQWNELKNTLGSSEPVLRFKIKIFANDPSKLLPRTRQQFYLQLKKEIYKGTIPCTVKTAMQLGGYLAQIELGDFIAINHDPGYLRCLKITRGQNEEFERRVSDLHKLHRGLTAREAIRRYLDIIKSLDSYGIILFKAKKEDTCESIQVGILLLGIYVNKIKLPWTRLIKATHTDNNIGIKIKKQPNEACDTQLNFSLSSFAVANTFWKTLNDHYNLARRQSASDPENAEACETKESVSATKKIHDKLSKLFTKKKCKRFASGSTATSIAPVRYQIGPPNSPCALPAHMRDIPDPEPCAEPSPASAPVRAPVSAPVRAPVSASTRAPVSASTRAPVSASTRAPVSAPGRASVSAPGRASVSAPGRASVPAPGRTPVPAPAPAETRSKGPPHTWDRRSNIQKWIPRERDKDPYDEIFHSSLQLLCDSLASGLIEEQFRKVPRKNNSLTTNDGALPCNASKNYRDSVLPCTLDVDDDCNRVHLETSSTDGDYINASYVNMELPGCIENRYIATQGPITNTIHDFWRMVQQERCHLVIMLVSVMENGVHKCQQYFPEVDEELELAQNFSVKCLMEQPDETGTYVFRELMLIDKQTDESCNREQPVEHMQFLGWPDSGIPDDSSSFIRFRDRVKDIRDSVKLDAEADDKPSIIVHCSAGVNRTGVFVLVDVALTMLEMYEPVLPTDILEKTRNLRPGFIQNAKLFRFACECICDRYQKLAFALGVID